MQCRVDSHEARLTPDLESRIRHKVETVFSRFVTVVRRVTVHLRDVNGPRGGPDKVCRVSVESIGGKVVIVEQDTAELRACAGALSRAVRVLVGRLDLLRRRGRRSR